MIYEWWQLFCLNRNVKKEKTMKYKMAMWIMGFITLFSVQGYAAEEKITFTPSEPTRPGMVEITVSGVTDSDEVSVDHFAYTVGIGDAGADGAAGIAIYAAIRKSTKPGNSRYTQSVKLFLGAGIYGVSFYNKEYNQIDQTGPDGWRVLHDYSTYRLAVVSPGFYLHESPLTVSIEKSSLEPKGSDTFTAHQVSLPGYDGLYWGTFQWNPYTLSWTLKDAGLEK